MWLFVRSWSRAARASQCHLMTSSACCRRATVAKVSTTGPFLSLPMSLSWPLVKSCPEIPPRIATNSVTSWSSWTWPQTATSLDWDSLDMYVCHSVSWSLTTVIRIFMVWNIPPPSKVVLHVKMHKNHKIFSELSATLIVQLKMCWIGPPSCCDCW